MKNWRQFVKGPLSRQSACAVLIDTNFFWPIKIVTLSRAPRISCESAWSYTCLSKISALSAGIWPFVCKEYLSCLCCVKAVGWIQIQTLHFLPTCMHISDVRPPIFSSFFFLSKQDGYGTKVIFVSSRFQNPLLEESVILDEIQLKTQNKAFKSFIDD